MTSQNPYDAPTSAELPVPAAAPATGSVRTRMGVLGCNTVLLVLFPPTCCPCGLGPIGFIVQPYMLLLGFPSIFAPLAIPHLRTASELAFLSLYVINYVLMSYGLGVIVDRLQRRRRPIGTRVNTAVQPNGGGGLSDDAESAPVAH